MLLGLGVSDRDRNTHPGICVRRNSKCRLHEERQAVQVDQWVGTLPYGHLARAAVVEDIDHRIDNAETQFKRAVQAVYRLRIEALRRGLL